MHCGCINKRRDRSCLQNYLKKGIHWQDLIMGVIPIKGGCGDIYELTNQRPNESFAIADMRNLPFAEPHYHVETEIYFVLQGKGLVVVCSEDVQVQTDSVIVIPPNIAHFTVPDEDIVLAVVNTQPFIAEHYIVVKDSREDVKFDKQQFDKLTPSTK